MKKLLIAVLLTLLIATTGLASQQATFTATFDYHASADSFSMYVLDEPSGSTKVATTDTVGSMSWQQTIDPSKCYTYYMTATTGTVESVPSNTFTWCPKAPIPTLVIRPQAPTNVTISVSIDTNGSIE